MSVNDKIMSIRDNIWNFVTIYKCFGLFFIFENRYFFNKKNISPFSYIIFFYF